MDATLSPLAFGKRARTRDDLLAAAQTLLLERRAGSIAVTDIAARAGVSHGTFYNYFDGIDALLDGLGALAAATHAVCVRRPVATAADAAEVFAIKTRQTLRFAARGAAFGRLLFDAGLPVDRLAGALREDLLADIVAGVATRDFEIETPAVTASLAAGCVLGAALDLYRGRLPEASIDPAAEEILRLVGAKPDAARRAATRPARFVEPPALPLTWRAIADVAADA